MGGGGYFFGSGMFWCNKVISMAEHKANQITGYPDHRQNPVIWIIESKSVDPVSDLLCVLISSRTSRISLVFFL